jgi:hypothetical protein
MTTIRLETHWDRDSRLRLIETPASRATDPSTSADAEAEINATGLRAFQQSQTTSAVRRFPGRTMAELARETGLDRYMLGRRISECETAGIVFRGLKRRCSVTGRMAEPWFAVDPGMKAAA